MLYELRKYEVLPGKLPPLLNRFDTFTIHKWAEYGIRPIGFFTPQIGAANNLLIYILGWESAEERVTKFGKWQADPERARVWEETEKDGPLIRRVGNLLMQPTAFSQLDQGIAYGPPAEGRAPYLFELREYDAMPGKLPNVVRRFGDFTIGAFKQHGFRQVGYWTPFLGGYNNQLIYMLAWESYEERNAAFDAFTANPERQRVFAESEKNGAVVERIVNTMLKPTSFSAMK
jgi:hypothetical protein